jgi:hypothetical protein
LSAHGQLGDGVDFDGKRLNKERVEFKTGKIEMRKCSAHEFLVLNLRKITIASKMLRLVLEGWKIARDGILV